MNFADFLNAYSDATVFGWKEPKNDLPGPTNDFIYWGFQERREIVGF